MDHRVGHRPAADQHLPVIAVIRGDGFRPDAVLAELLLQKRERIDTRMLVAARIDFLQRHDMGIPAVDQGDHAIEIEARIAAERAVDIPGEDADRAGRAVQDLLPNFATRTCTPPATASHSRTTANSMANSPGFGSLRIRTNW